MHLLGVVCTFEEVCGESIVMELRRSKGVLY